MTNQTLSFWNREIYPNCCHSMPCTWACMAMSNGHHVWAKVWRAGNLSEQKRWVQEKVTSRKKGKSAKGNGHAYLPNNASWACCSGQAQPRCGTSHKGHLSYPALPTSLPKWGDPGVPQDPGALGHAWGIFFRRFAFLKKLIAEAFYLRIGLCLIKSVFLQNFRAKTVSPWILDS